MRWRDGKRALEVLENHFATHAFLLSEEFSIADIALYAYVHRSHEGGFEVRDYTALQSWFARIEARPGYISIDTVPSSP